MVIPGGVSETPNAAVNDNTIFPPIQNVSMDKGNGVQNDAVVDEL